MISPSRPITLDGHPASALFAVTEPMPLEATLPARRAPAFDGNVRVERVTVARAQARMAEGLLLPGAPDGRDYSSLYRGTIATLSLAVLAAIVLL